MNAKKYRVRWISLLTGEQGNGGPISLEDGKAWVKHLNAQYPNIKHWVEPIEKEDLT